MDQLRTSARKLPRDRHRLGQIVVLTALRDEVLVAGGIIKHALDVLHLLLFNLETAVDFAC